MSNEGKKEELAQEQKPRLSIVVGVDAAGENIPKILDALGASGSTDVEVLICYTATTIIPETAATRYKVVYIEAPANALIPELWALGIEAAKADHVATLTAHCIPADDWVRNALQLDLESYVACGGIINLPSSASNQTAAIHILRYASVTFPQKQRVVSDLAADNAVYRRKDISDHKDLLAGGFWEQSFHHRFRADGLELQFSPTLIAAHENLYSAKQFLRQRRRHGREFGLTRVEHKSLPHRMVMVVLAPFTYPVFLVKLVQRALQSPSLKPRLLRSFPWLMLFTAAWTIGEISGYWAALWKRPT